MLLLSLTACGKKQSDLSNMTGSDTETESMDTEENLQESATDPELIHMEDSAEDSLEDAAENSGEEPAENSMVSDGKNGNSATKSSQVSSKANTQSNRFSGTVSDPKCYDRFDDLDDGKDDEPAGGLGEDTGSSVLSRPYTELSSLSLTDMENARIGNRVAMGTFEQDANASNGKEPIVWRVLDKDGSKLLLLSEYVLDFQPYDDSAIGESDWHDCSLRKWLNEDFYENSFTASEKKQICETHIDKNGLYHYYSYPTDDHVFLLYDDNYYFDGYEECIAYPTSYAISKSRNSGQSMESTDACAWLVFSNSLYTDYDDEDHNVLVRNSSGAYDYEYSSDPVGVRPALWVDLDAASSHTVNSSSTGNKVYQTLYEDALCSICLNEFSTEAGSLAASVTIKNFSDRDWNYTLSQCAINEYSFFFGTVKAAVAAGKSKHLVLDLEDTYYHPSIKEIGTFSALITRQLSSDSGNDGTKEVLVSNTITLKDVPVFDPSAYQEVYSDEQVSVYYMGFRDNDDYPYEARSQFAWFLIENKSDEMIDFILRDPVFDGITSDSFGMTNVRPGFCSRYIALNQDIGSGSTCHLDLQVKKSSDSSEFDEASSSSIDFVIP